MSDSSIPHPSPSPSAAAFSMPLFLGYETLEDFAKAASPFLPACLLLLRFPGTANSHGARTDDLVVLVQQRDLHSVIHYCRLTAARTAMLNGQPFQLEEHERRWKAAESLHDIVRAWLEEAHYEIIRATYATPRDWQYLDASTRIACFDGATSLYVPITETPEPAVTTAKKQKKETPEQHAKRMAARGLTPDGARLHPFECQEAQDADTCLPG